MAGLTFSRISIVVAFLALLAPFVSAKGLLETRNGHDLFARAGPTTGCTCYGFTYSINNGPFYRVLASQGGSTAPALGTNQEGWCFVNGVMTSTGANRIRTAIVSGVNTQYVNTTWAKSVCNFGCAGCTTTQCATYIQTQYTNELFAGNYLSTCTYPSSGFTPTDCKCAFTCTTAGYVVCGRSCMNPLTQTCVSDVPVAKARRRGLNKRFMCPEGLSYCPLEGGGHECLNTQSDLESCGGCTYRPKHDSDTPLGVDCSAIPGVADVACVQGSCTVARCDSRHRLINGTCEPIAVRQNVWTQQLR